VCTVSWLRTRSGFELFFNRDERLTRAPEEGPRLRARAGVRYLAPRDPEAGGTWITVNEHGLAAGLLNGYVASLGAVPPVWTSRGLLLAELADAREVAALVARLEATDLAPYQPFVLLALDPAHGSVAAWDGRALEVDADADARCPLASSGVDQPAARARRRELYAEVLAEHGGPSAAALLAFQRCARGGPSALTPSMQRDDAATRSLVHVAVDAREVRMAHAPGRPDRTALAPALTLARAHRR
jgi:uncharacterized protein with NRDE domain